jgi:hypothetical protein
MTPTMMKDFLAQLEHLERQIAECDLISNLSTDVTKGETFRRLAEQYRAMAEHVRSAMSGIPPTSTGSI